MGKIKSLKNTVLTALLITPMLIVGPTQISTAQAYETNSAGYEVPDLTGRSPISQGEKTDDVSGLRCKYEIFDKVQSKSVIRLSHNGNIFAYVIDQDRDSKADFAIVDSNGDQVFESKYSPGEKWGVPDWAR